MTSVPEFRIFFALWPSPQVREALQQVAMTCELPVNSRRVPEYNLHMTLHFIGNVSLDQRDCLSERAGHVRADSFEMKVALTGCFEKPKVAWLGLQSCPAELQLLQQKLGISLQHCGYQPESRPYNPHVTIMRKTRRIPDGSGFEPVIWPVTQFTLINSRSTSQGVRCEVMKSYDLQ